jgi:hypothetical protein
MAASLVILLFASAFALPAQSNSLGAPGCGPANVKLEVKSDHDRHAAPDVDPGKALIVFLQDDARSESRPGPTTRFGMDGRWVGATQSHSYFYVLVEAGERRVCANWQSRVGPGPKRSTEAMHLSAEAGKTYYVRAQDIALFDGSGRSIGTPEVKLDLVDSDEALLLVNSFALSSSHFKKWSVAQEC